METPFPCPGDAGELLPAFPPLFLFSDAGREEAILKHSMARSADPLDAWVTHEKQDLIFTSGWMNTPDVF